MLHGLKNTSTFFQSTISSLFHELQDAMIAWIDDFTVHAKSKSELVDHIENYFGVSSKHDLSLSAKSCLFYTKNVKWCGWIMDKEGYQLEKYGSQSKYGLSNKCGRDPSIRPLLPVDE